MHIDPSIQIIKIHAEGEVGNVVMSDVAPPLGDTLWQQWNGCIRHPDDKGIECLILAENA